jgi:hypothetical protein
MVRPTRIGPSQTKWRIHRSFRGLNRRTLRPVCGFSPAIFGPL